MANRDQIERYNAMMRMGAPVGCYICGDDTSLERTICRGFEVYRCYGRCRLFSNVTGPAQFPANEVAATTTTVTVSAVSTSTTPYLVSDDNRHERRAREAKEKRAAAWNAWRSQPHPQLDKWMRRKRRVLSKLERRKAGAR